ncbi:glycosyltransferase N-terminal domain-containing protein, partial [Caminibacter sp.]
NVRFLPYEIFIPFWIRPCKSLVVMEAELWYALFYFAKRRCKKTILLNARISERSYPKYLKFKWFYKKIFENIDIVLAQSEKDKERLISLGAKNVEVVGNVKSYFEPNITREYIKTKPLLVIASTHRGEEEKILSQIDLKKWQVAVVPRHPERFDEVFEIMKKFGKPVRLSEKCKVKNEKCRLYDFMLIDKMGELINLYKVADCVILGGSFVDNVGGHNPIESAYFNVPIISGKHFFNQKALYREVDGIEVCEDYEINDKLKSLKSTKIKNRVDIEKIINLIQSID